MGKKMDNLADLSYPELIRKLDGKRLARRNAKRTNPAPLPATQEEREDGNLNGMREAAIPLPEETAANDVNTHSGHRLRLRQRFRDEEGFDHFQDHEILELILTYGAPRKDVNNEAHELLDTFGSLKAVLEARPEALMRVKGIGEGQATLISMIVSLTKVWERRTVETMHRILNRSELERYCRGLLMGNRTESFYVICVDAQCRILGRRKISEGSLSEVSAYPRSVMETALNYNAHSVFLCHNHPGGTCGPSPEDIASTAQLQRLLNGIGILVLDHIIVAGSQTYSMAQHGDLDFRTRSRSV